MSIASSFHRSIYGAISFSVAVEALNQRAARRGRTLSDTPQKHDQLQIGSASGRNHDPGN
jgi:hypothetical protein